MPDFEDVVVECDGDSFRATVSGKEKAATPDTKGKQPILGMQATDTIITSTKSAAEGKAEKKAAANADAIAKAIKCSGECDRDGTTCEKHFTISAAIDIPPPKGYAGKWDTWTTGGWWTLGATDWWRFSYEAKAKVDLVVTCTCDAANH